MTRDPGAHHPWWAPNSRLRTGLRMIGLLRAYPVRSALGLVLGVAMVVLATRLPLVLGAMVDNVIRHRRGALGADLVIFLSLAVARFACASLRRSIGGSLGVLVERDLRNRMARRILALDASWHDRSRTGQLLARATSDVAAIRAFLGFGSVFIVLNVLTATIAFVQMWRLSPRLSLVTLGTAPVLAVGSYLYNRRAYRVSERVQQRVGSLTSVAEENTAGIHVVKAFGREALRQAAFTQEANALLAENMIATRLRARFAPMLTLLPALSVVAVLWYGSRLVARHDITLGTLVAVNSYLAMLDAPLRSASSLSGMAQRAFAGAARVFDVLGAEPAIADRPDATTLPADVRWGCRVTLDQVSFRFPDADRPALAGLDLDIAPGERVALVGESGAGKSTLAALLSRAYEPTSGRITVDGHDITALTIRSLRTGVTVVPAEPVMFAGTVRDNLTLGAVHADDDQLSRALWAAAALGFVRRLPDGLDTVLGERGTTLSGGQQQRLAIARALLSQPRLLILDDALSHLDAVTEAAVLDRLRRPLGGVTVLLLASGQADLRLAGRVLAIEGGRLTGAAPAAGRSRRDRSAS